MYITYIYTLFNSQGKTNFHPPQKKKIKINKNHDDIVDANGHFLY